MTSFFALGDARAHLSELVGRVDEHHERVVITVRGRPAAVLLGMYDFESMQETLDILNDPDTMRRLAEADADVQAGDVVADTDLEGFAAA